MIARLRQWARAIKRDVAVLVLAARDPAVPLAAKLLAGAVAAYALSPIDLIPDFIPVLGLIDDLLLVPAGIWLVLRMIPPAVLADLRCRATEQGQLPRSRMAAAVIVALWILGSLWLAIAAQRYFQNQCLAFRPPESPCRLRAAKYHRTTRAARSFPPAVPARRDPRA